MIHSDGLSINVMAEKSHNDQHYVKEYSNVMFNGV